MARPRIMTDRVIDALAGDAIAAKSFRGDRRSEERFPYSAAVGLMLVSPDGHTYPPIVVQARDLSVLGIAVMSRQMIHPGSNGALQLVRSDGRVAIVGVTVRYCIYCGGMQHSTGLAFGPLPDRMSPTGFLDGTGRLALFGPGLEVNQASFRNRRDDR